MRKCREQLTMNENKKLYKKIDNLDLKDTQKEYVKALIEVAYRLGKLDASLEITEIIKENEDKNN